MRLNLPNKITLARIALIPAVLALYLVEFPYHEIVALIAFVLCCCTDFIDGGIARKRNLVTDLGKFLDPVADKVIVVMMIVVYLSDGTLPGWHNAVIAGLVLSREILITAFRIIAVQKKIVLAADVWGKVKTVCLDVGLIVLMLSGYRTGTVNGNPFHLFRWAGLIIYYAGAFFALFSGANYILKNKAVLAAGRADGAAPSGESAPEGGSGEPDLENGTVDGVPAENAVYGILVEKGLTVSVAESLTGGLVAAKLINVPGMSKCFREGITAYSNEAKQERLGVREETLRLHGAVSGETAEEMAAGLINAGADVAVSTTGIAGPDGGSAEKPVGLVWFGFADAEGTKSVSKIFSGTRAEIREKAANFALCGLYGLLGASE